MMSFLNNFIPLLGSFLPEFSNLFLIPLICLAFLATVPFIVRIIIKR